MPAPCHCSPLLPAVTADLASEAMGLFLNLTSVERCILSVWFCCLLLRMKSVRLSHVVGVNSHSFYTCGARHCVNTPRLTIYYSRASSRFYFVAVASAAAVPTLACVVWSTGTAHRCGS